MVMNAPLIRQSVVVPDRDPCLKSHTGTIATANFHDRSRYSASQQALLVAALEKLIRKKFRVQGANDTVDGWRKRPDPLSPTHAGTPRSPSCCPDGGHACPLRRE